VRILCARKVAKAWRKISVKVMESALGSPLSALGFRSRSMSLGPRA